MKRDYSRSGINTLKKALNAKGRAKVRCGALEKLDMRNPFARRLAEWRADVIAALGGDANLTPQKLTILDAVVRDLVLLTHLDNFLVTLPSIVNRRKRSVFPIVEQRMRIADALLKHLQVLGLDRVAAPIVDLHTYISTQPEDPSPADESPQGSIENTAPGAILGEKNQASGAPDQPTTTPEDEK